MTDDIAEIGIDVANRLYLRPTRSSYPHIHRAAKGIQWDPVQRRLYGEAPKEFSHADWFRQILNAVRDEYGDNLTVNPSTIWSNVPVSLQSEIKGGEPT